MTDLRERAAEVSGHIRDDVVYGSEELVDFARRFAVSDKLRHEALNLRFEVSQRKLEPETLAPLSDDMLALVEKIARDRESASATDIEAKQQVIERLKQYSNDTFEAKSVCRARNIGKILRDGQRAFHLEGVSLDIRLGEITGVVGENANGKTTLFRLLVGELKHGEGDLWYPELGADEGAPVNWAKIKSQIGYVPQSLTEWHGSLEDNLRYAAAVKGITGVDNDRELRYVAERLGLTEYLEVDWHSLSGGYKLRFELARALIWRPKFLVLDEPLANLDIKTQLTLLRDIRDLARSFSNPIGVILSSQHLHEVEALADNILFLSRGKVIYNGPTEKVGEDRKFNMFELNVADEDISRRNLRTRLQHPKIRRLAFNGLVWEAVTDRDFTAQDLFALAQQEHVPLSYFRDISNSVKQLFHRPDEEMAQADDAA